MDVFFVLNGVTFVWNEEKAGINPSNNDGVTFQQAVEAFFDPFLVVVDASRNDQERENVMIRIISARKATFRGY
ncbi:BrnT family toxin [Nostoc sp.]|uniref:BrnT family toxin n=1 Tax=Nostoc sp. TaxID=1180 RepID=UPI002FF5B267